MRWSTSSETSRFKLLKMGREAALGAVEAHSAGDLRAAKRPRRRGQRELLPGDEALDLSVRLAELRERSCENVVSLDRQKCVLGWRRWR
jgi:hypothetical protein